MKKINLKQRLLRCLVLKKILIMMKLTAILFFLTLFQVKATSTYSQTQRMSLDFKSKTLSEVFSVIEENSDYSFFYRNELLAKSKLKTGRYEDTMVSEILDDVLKDENLTYTSKGKIIMIVAKKGSAAPINAQQKRSLSGKVTDSSGAPLPGVTIVIKGSTKGTITGVDGAYSLMNVPENAVLIFSFIGMKTEEVPVAGKDMLNVAMEEESIGIEEVVAVGYGSVRKKDLTGAVSSVTGETLKDVPVTSAAEALTGRMAGVQVTKTQGSPDATIEIRVRGGGSVTQDNSPLYLVDGFPVDNINDIAPTDIQSIDVLKDASSTAIYGARGANGVILITTKGGTEKKGTVSYHTYYGIKNVSKTFGVLNPYEFVMWMYESFQNKSTLQSKYGDFTDYDLYKEIPGSNWQEEVFGRTGNEMYHNLAFTGGTATSKYNVSLTRNDSKEVMLGSGYNRTNVTINYSQKVNKWLTIDLKPRISDTDYEGAGTTGGQYRLANIIQYRPVNGLMDFVDEELADLDEYDPRAEFAYDPLSMLKSDYRRSNLLVVNLNGAATINLSKLFTYNFSYGAQYTRRGNDRFYGLNLFETYRTGRPKATKGMIDNDSYRMSNTLTFKKSNFLTSGLFATVMAGQELTSSQNKTTNNTSDYFPVDIDPVSALSMMQLAELQTISTSIGNSVRVSSFFGRLALGYKGKYNATATIRADGSSKFAPGNQWGYFPSFGMGWNISEEEFLRTADWLTFLKFRISYGAAGNNRISDNAWQKTFSVGTGSMYMGSDQTVRTPILKASNILSNNGLKWETTVSRDMGFDFSLAKNRLSGSIDFYKNSTRDLLIRAVLPSASGYGYQWQNIGETSNKGAEVTLDAALVKKKDFRLNLSFNIGINKGMIEKLGETKRWTESSALITPGSGGIPFVDDYLVEEGGQVGQMYGYQNEGMYSFDDFNFDAETGTYTLKENVASDETLISARWFGPGTLKLKDQNGDYVVDENDKVVVGNSNPKHTGGFTLMSMFKGLDLSASFNWVYGNDIYNANKIWYTSLNSGYPYRNMLNTMNSDNRFTIINKETGAVVSDPGELAAMNRNKPLWSPNFTSPRLNDWYVEDGSFLRLNTLTIGYTLPKHFTQKFGINRLRLYATGYNLWVWTNYSGYDPEVSTVSNPLTPGMDWQAYPRNRAYNFGLDVEF